MASRVNRDWRAGWQKARPTGPTLGITPVPARADVTPFVFCAEAALHGGGCAQLLIETASVKYDGDTAPSEILSKPSCALRLHQASMVEDSIPLKRDAPTGISSRISSSIRVAIH
jgi:hypothetical protein